MLCINLEASRRRGILQEHLNIWGESNGWVVFIFSTIADRFAPNTKSSMSSYKWLLSLKEKHATDWILDCIYGMAPFLAYQKTFEDNNSCWDFSKRKATLIWNLWKSGFPSRPLPWPHDSSEAFSLPMPKKLGKRTCQPFLAIFFMTCSFSFNMGPDSD